jgi:Raf kinase inhibitor-like YbhB/YbcL family protein
LPSGQNRSTIRAGYHATARGPNKGRELQSQQVFPGKLKIKNSGGTMGSSFKSALALTIIVCFASSLTHSPANAQQRQTAKPQFQVTSSEFENQTTLPISMINNSIVNGVNACSIDGSQGGDESPDLEWTNAPAGTKSFVVVLYDVTAAFTHWGMYNIPATATGLPQNAGVAGSSYGQQIINDSFTVPSYYGPCPPPNYPPNLHHYQFTVYALDETLTLTTSPNYFQPNAETLYHALINEGQFHHILASARLVGFYSTTPTK